MLVTKFWNVWCLETGVILASTNTIFTQKVMSVNMWDLKFWNFSHLKNPRFGLGKFFHFFEFMIKKRRGMDKFQFSLTIKIMISVAKKYNRFSKRHKKTLTFAVENCKV